MLCKKCYDIANSAPFQNVTLGTRHHPSYAWSLCPVNNSHCSATITNKAFHDLHNFGYLARNSILFCYLLPPLRERTTRFHRQDKNTLALPFARVAQTPSALQPIKVRDCATNLCVLYRGSYGDCFSREEEATSTLKSK